MKAVIMAGGFGTRIQPLTINLPKPMIPLFNKPIILHIIELLKRHGITDLVLLLYHQPMSIKSFFRDGSDFGVRITYVTPLEDYGTAGAVKAASRHLDGPFLIISGDLLTDFDLSTVIETHRARGAKATMTLTSVKDPLQFGVVITAQDGKVTKFLEKPGWGEVFSDTINTGIYLIEPDVLDLIPEGENRDWSKDIFPLMLERDLGLYGCMMEGYWQDIGNPDAYLDACRDVFGGRVRVDFDEQLQPDEGGQLYLGRDVALCPPDRMQGMVQIGDYTRVLGPARLKNCVIGRNCVIEEGVELEDAILWDNVYVKRGSRVRGAVLCHNTRLGQKAVVQEGAVIADDTSVGDEAQVNKGVLVWPRKEIESGATVTTNLIWGERWRKSIFDGAVVRGLSNMELTPEFAAKLGAAFGSTLPRDAVILAGRDACGASRMLKRSFVGGLLSTGVSIRDCKMVPLPVLTYKLQTFGEVAGVYFRQSPQDPAITEVIFYDQDGAEISSASAKGIERLFFKENFRRAHYSEPGAILEIPQLLEFYRQGYLRALNQDLLRQKRPRIVVDLNHSPASQLLPSLLGNLGCEVTELNSFIDATLSTGSPDSGNRPLVQLSRIVRTLGAEAGFWLSPSGDRLVMIDDHGHILEDIELLCLLSQLACRGQHRGNIIVPVSAPSSIETMASDAKLSVSRCKVDSRSLVEAARTPNTLLAAGTDGRSAIPAFQPHPDALFTMAHLLERLAESGESLSSVLQAVPRSAYRHLQTPCPLDSKGRVMRKMSETSMQQNISLIDGVRVQFDDGWVLVLPDQHRPLVHVIAESADGNRADQLALEYRERVDRWKGGPSDPAR